MKNFISAIALALFVLGVFSLTIAYSAEENTGSALEFRPLPTPAVQQVLPEGLIICNTIDQAIMVGTSVTRTVNEASIIVNNTFGKNSCGPLARTAPATVTPIRRYERPEGTIFILQLFSPLFGIQYSWAMVEKKGQES